LLLKNDGTKILNSRSFKAEKVMQKILKSEQNPPASKTKWSFWTVFTSTFLTILFAEMGDKTQLATLLLAAESGSPWLVFTGASLALISTSLLGVVIGYWLAKRLSPQILDLFLALLLLFVAAWLLADVINN
jgi:putative Ca2+/H+ antiporter (TMEM165/GDT1 family)